MTSQRENLQVEIYNVNAFGDSKNHLKNISDAKDKEKEGRRFSLSRKDMSYKLMTLPNDYLCAGNYYDPQFYLFFMEEKCVAKDKTNI